MMVPEPEGVVTWPLKVATAPVERVVVAWLKVVVPRIWMPKPCAAATPPVKPRAAELTVRLLRKAPAVVVGPLRTEVVLGWPKLLLAATVTL